MRNSSIILLGKSLSKVSKRLNLGHGSTWPGHLALKMNAAFIENLLKNSKTKVIMVAGTNGKTTTARMIRTVLEENNHVVIHNESGANLLNGIASTLLLKANARGKISADYIILEVDENALPGALTRITPDYLLILNLFRDQLDRYGEVGIIAEKWRESIGKLDESTTLILNADDPQVAYLSERTNLRTSFFGLTKKTNGSTDNYSSDSLYCPRCNTKLSYNFKTYSHLGDWFCLNCKLKRPTIENITVPFLPLSGSYNEYNTFSVVLLAKLLEASNSTIEMGLRNVKPAFGRQEIIEADGKKVQILLSKNPTGFNESLRTVTELGAKHLLLVLNDRVADGHDVSWIWDVDFELFLQKFKSITISGDRTYDLGLRLKYASSEFDIEDELKHAIYSALDKTTKDETLFVLPTYTAMLEVRKILQGKSIL